VCELIPDEYEIIIRLSHDSGFVELEDGYGNKVDFPSNHEKLSFTIEDALQHALELVREARTLDGEQE
jgi:hypothetical protein